MFNLSQFKYLPENLKKLKILQKGVGNAPPYLSVDTREWGIYEGSRIKTYLCPSKRSYYKKICNSTSLCTSYPSIGKSKFWAEAIVGMIRNWNDPRIIFLGKMIRDPQIIFSLIIRHPYHFEVHYPWFGSFSP